MDPIEEQEQEIEVLRSIYPDELDVLSPTHFTIFLALETQSERKHALLLDVKYPPAYPLVPPSLAVTLQTQDAETLDGFDSDADDEAATLLNLAETISFDKADLADLLARINEEAEMSIGMPSVFAVAAILKDEGEQLFQRKVDAAQKAYDDELLAKVAEEQKKFQGTKVTRESFAAWRDAFRKEMDIEAKDIARSEKMHNGKMTGREIFERGLAGDDEVEEELSASLGEVAV